MKFKLFDLQNVIINKIIYTKINKNIYYHLITASVWHNKWFRLIAQFDKFTKYNYIYYYSEFENYYDLKLKLICKFIKNIIISIIIVNLQSYWNLKLELTN